MKNPPKKKTHTPTLCASPVSCVTEGETNHRQTSIASCKDIVLADLTGSSGTVGEGWLINGIVPPRVPIFHTSYGNPFAKETTPDFGLWWFCVFRPVGRTDSDKLQMLPWASVAPATSYFAGLWRHHLQVRILQATRSPGKSNRVMWGWLLFKAHADAIQVSRLKIFWCQVFGLQGPGKHVGWCQSTPCWDQWCSCRIQDEQCDKVPRSLSQMSRFRIRKNTVRILTERWYIDRIWGIHLR